MSVIAFIMYLSCVIPFPPITYLPHLLISLALYVTHALNIAIIPIVAYPFDCKSDILQHTAPIACTFDIIFTNFYCTIWKEEVG